MPPPGGDVIGRRRLDPHLDGFAALGASFRHERDIVIDAPVGGLRAGQIFMDEPSVMAPRTSYGGGAHAGRDRHRNAACEPHVQDLARMLVKMGADIRGIGSNILTITGRKELGGCVHDIGPDHIEIGSFMALAGVTGGEMRIRDTDPDDLRMIRLVFSKLGLHSELDGADVLARRPEADRGARRRRVQGQGQDGPWPAFPADLTSIAVALATQVEGSC